jgi:hypothetical protein
LTQCGSVLSKKEAAFKTTKFTRFAHALSPSRASPFLNIFSSNRTVLTFYSLASALQAQKEFIKVRDFLLKNQPNRFKILPQPHFIQTPNTFETCDFIFAEETCQKEVQKQLECLGLKTSFLGLEKTSLKINFDDFRSALKLRTIAFRKSSLWSCSEKGKMIKNFFDKLKFITESDKGFHLLENYKRQISSMRCPMISNNDSENVWRRLETFVSGDDLLKIEAQVEPKFFVNPESIEETRRTLLISNLPSALSIFYLMDLMKPNLHGYFDAVLLVKNVIFITSQLPLFKKTQKPNPKCAIVKFSCFKAAALFSELLKYKSYQGLFFSHSREAKPDQFGSK